MKRTSLWIVSCFATLFFCAISVPSAKANQWNQATKLTFSEPVEIPGIALPAGTYWFTLMSDDPDRDIVQVWTENREHLLATIMTVPDYRLHSTGQTVIKFVERPSTQPEALRAWFYPDENYGHEFVYPESRAREIAKRTGRPVLSMRDDVAANITKPAKSAKEPSVMAMKQAQIQAINPSGEEVDKSQAMQPMPQGESQTTVPQH
jgi:hypothetical protein